MSVITKQEILDTHSGSTSTILTPLSEQQENSFVKMILKDKDTFESLEEQVPYIIGQ